MRRPLFRRRSVLLSFSFLFFAPPVGCGAMPITDPDPHKILADLRASLANLQAAAKNAPSDARLLVAVGQVAAAIAVLETPAKANPA